MSAYILSVYGDGTHDCSVSLFKDDELIFFVQSERFTRAKRSPWIDPKIYKHIYDNITKKIDVFINYCEKDEIKHRNYLKSLNFNVVEEYTRHSITHFHIENTNFDILNTHHNYHAISSFYLSPFDEAICLVVDSSGSRFRLFKEYINNSYMGLIGHETSSIIHINKKYKLNSLLRRARYYPVTCGIARDVEFNFSSLGITGLAEKDKVYTIQNLFKNLPFKFDLTTHIDVGQMYDTITNHIGFGPSGHGKTMGLSAYGNPNLEIPSFFVENTHETNMNLFTSGSELNSSLYPHLFEENKLDFQLKADLAYAVQKATEEMFLEKAKFIIQNTNVRNLIICGGCALNILAISKIKETYPEFNIFVDPIAGDAVHSIGHGLYAYKNFISNGDVEKKNYFNSIYLGPKYKKQYMLNDIETFMRNQNA